MDPFQKEFEEKYPVLRERLGAFLHTLYPPTRCTGMRGTMPIFVQCGRALWDTSGWIPIKRWAEANKWDEDTVAGCPTAALAIGIELKSTKPRLPSLRIVGEDGEGSGIQAHQLEALAALHRDGGIARLLWTNGGVVGVLDGDEIAATFHTYGVSLAAERLHKVPARGSRSVPWGLFREVDWVDHPEGVIVPPFKGPTIAEAAAAKRRRASRLIDKATKEEAERQDAGQFVKEESKDEEDTD